MNGPVTTSNRKHDFCSVSGSFYVIILMFPWNPRAKFTDDVLEWPSQPSHTCFPSHDFYSCCRSTFTTKQPLMPTASQATTDGYRSYKVTCFRLTSPCMNENIITTWPTMTHCPPLRDILKSNETSIIRPGNIRYSS